MTRVTLEAHAQRCDKPLTVDRTFARDCRDRGVHLLRYGCTAGHSAYEELVAPPVIERVVTLTPCLRCAQPFDAGDTEREYCDPCRHAMSVEVARRSHLRGILRGGRSVRCTNCQKPITSGRYCDETCRTQRLEVLAVRRAAGGR
jgi:hypothetical protein